MNRPRFAYWLGLGSLAVLTLATTAKAAERALIELFTSQGCSSCPPADRLLGQLSKNSSLVTLSLPIDYWDYLGWRDTLALHRHAQRQRGYARSRGDREVYTPQAVVNGVMHAVGSDKAAIEREINASLKNPATMAIPVTLTAGKQEITVAVAGGTVAHNGEVWLCGVEKAAQVHIGRGENRGRTVTYHNVVRGWHKLGQWNGKAVSWHVPVSKLTAGVDEVAAIVQEDPNGNPGRVLGAALIPLR